MEATKLCFVVAVLVSFTLWQPNGASGSVARLHGNVTIGAFLPIHASAENEPEKCTMQVDFRRVVETEAIIYAISKINSNSALLNGVTLGYNVDDTCENGPDKLLSMVNKLIKTQSAVALLLDLPQLLTQLISSYKSKDVPLLSLGPVPSPNSRNAVFYLEPGQPRLSNALLKLIENLNWTILDVLVDDEDDYKIFKDAVKSARVCVDNVFYAEKNTSLLPDDEDSKNPLLVFSAALQTLKHQKQKLFRGRRTLFAGDFLDIGEINSVADFPGAIAIQRKPARLGEFQEHLWESARDNNTWLGETLRKSTQFQHCRSSSSVDSCITRVYSKLVGEFCYAAKAIDAVYTVAHGLNKTSSFRSLTSEDISRKTNYTSPTGNSISFTTNRHLMTVDYQVYDLDPKNAAVVGTLETFPETQDTTAELALSKLQWSGSKGGHVNSSCLVTCPKGLTPLPSSGRFSKCCVTCTNRKICEKGSTLNAAGTKCVTVRLDYLRWHHPVSIIIMLLVAAFFCVLVCLVNLYVKKAQTPTILTSKLATTPLLLSLFLTLVIPLLPILKPSTTSCNAFTFGFVHGLGIPLCILISRSHSFYKRFRSEDGNLKRKVFNSDPQNIIAVVLILFGLLLSIIFLSVSPAHVIYFDTDNPGVEYIECSIFSRGRFLYPFFYTIILIIIFSVKNFSSVTQEEDIYEAHFAALSMFGYYLLSLLTLIIFYGVHGKVKVMFICFLTFLHLVNFLVFIFCPKCYVIVYKRDPTPFSPFNLRPRTEDEFLLSVDKDNDGQSSA